MEEDGWHHLKSKKLYWKSKIPRTHIYFHELIQAGKIKTKADEQQK